MARFKPESTLLDKADTCYNEPLTKSGATHIVPPALLAIALNRPGFLSVRAAIN